jgi:hypothetical protein
VEKDKAERELALCELRLVVLAKSDQSITLGLRAGCESEQLYRPLITVSDSLRSELR